MKKSLLFLFILFSIGCTSQSFQWQAVIDSVKSDGFYKILINPEISTHLKPGYGDLRIFTGNEEVSYILKKEEPSKTTSLFKEYEIVSKDLHAGGISYIVLHNKDKNAIDNIHLDIRNADVMKRIRITGSDDQKEWFMVKDEYEFYSANNPKGTSEIKILNFPLSNYEYYRLEINDKKSRPIDILKAGYFDYSSEKGKYTEVPSPVITQKDSAKESYIRISFSSPQYFDQLKLEISGPVYYKRQATLSEVNRNKKGEYHTEVTNMELSSDNNHEYDVSLTKASELLLRISNDDNVPLKIKSVRALQLNTNGIAYLFKGKNYILKFGDEKAEAPVYDLQYFNNKIPDEIPALTTSKPGKIISAQQGASFTFFSSPWFIWSAIGIVIILLSFITVRMLSEMGKAN